MKVVMRTHGSLGAMRYNTVFFGPDKRRHVLDSSQAAVTLPLLGSCLRLERIS